MAGSTATSKSRYKDPNHCEVFIMGYNPDETGVLQVWDAELEFEGSEAQ